jgi:D-alanyl-D-alanine carboxypeptidase
MCDRDLVELLTTQELAAVRKLTSVDPAVYNISHPSFGIHPIPADLVTIADQTYVLHGREGRLQPKYLPPEVYAAFTVMNDALGGALGDDRRLNVFSGYRSPTYQRVVFMCELKRRGWNIAKTLAVCAPPECSEHCNPEQQGVDFAPRHGISRLEDFDQTREFAWLEREGSRYGFHLSYPAGNGNGVSFEPWHWHYKKPE